MLSEMSDSSTVFWNSEQGVALLAKVLQDMGLALVELDPSQEKADFSISGHPDTEISRVRGGHGGWFGINLPLRSRLGDRLAERLASETRKPAAVFYEFDQTAWGLTIFRPDGVNSSFVNRPEFLELKRETLSLSGNAAADMFGVGRGKVIGYFRLLGDGEGADERAYPTDEHALGDHWVRTDVMSALGLAYPDPTDGNTKPYFIAEKRSDRTQPVDGSDRPSILKSLFSRFRRG